MTAIGDLASRYVDELAELNPNAATAMGVPGHDDRITDFSPDGFARLDDLRRRYLTALRDATLSDDRDRVARDMMSESLTNQVESYEMGDHYRGLAILGSPLQSIRSVFDSMPKATASDWATIATRLGKVPEALERFRETLRAGIDRSVVPAVRQVEECAKQCDTWSGRAGNPPFFQTIVDGWEATGIDDATTSRALSDAAAAGSAAFLRFGAFLREELAPVANPRDAVGPDRYLVEARGFTGATLDLEGTYRWGWDQLYEIEEEMRRTANRIKSGASIRDAVVLLESDPARAIDGVEPFQHWMQDLQDQTIAELNGKHFDIPEPIQHIEAMIAPPGGALAMYYTGPSEDFSRPGRTWYPTGGKTRFPLWGEVSIAYHEGVPGHHLERASVKYQSESLTRFQRMFGTSGYIEGWALYAERLMAELGYLENPDYYLGMLRAQALRCVRVVVDIGMHLELEIPRTEKEIGGQPWTPELGHAFTRDRSQFPPDFTASEVTRYLGLPGQAISYKVGERVWLESREAAKQRAGSGFNLKRWHADAFRLGPMGLDQMKREMAGAG